MLLLELLDGAETTIGAAPEIECQKRCIESNALGLRKEGGRGCAPNSKLAHDRKRETMLRTMITDPARKGWVEGGNIIPVR